MTRPLKKYRVVWIDAKQRAIVTVDDTDLENALKTASEKLAEYEENLPQNERIYQPIQRRLYRVDPRHPKGTIDENHKVAYA